LPRDFFLLTQSPGRKPSGVFAFNSPSLGAFQGMLGPMTPLGQEAIQRVALGVGKKLGLNIVFEKQTLFAVAGERIWIKASDVLRNPLSSRVMHAFLGIGEPGTRLILDQLAEDPRIGASKGHLRLSTLHRVIRFMLPPLSQIPLSIFQPEKARSRFDAKVDEFLQTVRIPPGADRFERLANIAAFMDTQGGLAQALGVILPLFIPIMAPSLMALNQISRMLPADGSISAMDVTRGMPRNVTTEMDLSLWQVANVIRTDPGSAVVFISKDAKELSVSYLAGELPPASQKALAAFMAQYGMRGPGEIDLGQVRWREDPTQLMQTLQSYLQIAPEAAPDILFTRNVQAAEESIERMAACVRRQRGGWLKEKQLRQAARRVRILLGARETPKFTAVRAMGIVRNALLACGAEFVAACTLLRPDDLFFLHVAELAALSHHEERDWKSLVAGRRQTYEREHRRRQVPRVLVSDGRAFYEGVGAETDSADLISGSPVSPGVVEGNVRVVLNPRGAQLEPGEILVCPGTDPAWTPLFMAAGGLVMEVGGMMTHGSVVAREYGIPAVVGVYQATLRLKDGQHIRLDGSSGKITILYQGVQADPNPLREQHPPGLQP
jgi:phosphohistidine swiveling domain-containing protein